MHNFHIRPWCLIMGGDIRGRVKSVAKAIYPELFSNNVWYQTRDLGWRGWTYREIQYTTLCFFCPFCRLKRFISQIMKRKG